MNLPEQLFQNWRQRNASIGGDVVLAFMRPRRVRLTPCSSQLIRPGMNLVWSITLFSS